jgi:MFS family permease
MTRPSEATSILAVQYRRVTIGIVALIALAAFEAMAVATAMPVAARELDGFRLYAWAFTGFLIAVLFATAVAGDLADRTGPAKPLVGGTVVFGTGLVVAGLAPAMWPFVVGRLVQGLGVGAMIVSVYVLVAQVYPAALRPRVFAAISAAWVLPSILGPLIAGVITEQLSWRLVFLGLIPCVLPPLLLIGPVLRRLPVTDRARRESRIRWALALAVGAATMQLAGQQAEHRRWLLAVGGVLVGTAVLAPGVRKLLPRGTMRLRRGLPSVVAVRGLVAGAFLGAESFIPLMLVEHRGLSPTLGGLSITGGAFGWAAGSWWQGRPSLGTQRSRLVVLGAGLSALGIAVAGLAALPVVPALSVAVGWIVAGTGMGLAMSSMSVMLIELSEVKSQGANAAALQISDALGSIISIGIGGVLFATLRSSTSAAVVFVSIFAVMTAIAAASVAAAPRVRPADMTDERAGGTPGATAPTASRASALGSVRGI